MSDASRSTPSSAGAPSTSGDAIEIDPSILEANLRSLEARHPAALGMIEGVEPYPREALATTKSGEWTLTLQGDRDEARLLHSRYRPRDEARRALPEEWDELGVLVFFGPGLGYGPVEAAPRLGSENMLLWIEHDPRLFRTALEVVDLTAVLDHSGVRLWIGCEPAEVERRLRQEITRILSGRIHVISHPPSLQHSPDAYRAYAKALEDFAREGAVNVQTTFVLARVSAKNQAGNLGAYARSPGVGFLRNQLAGQPAFLIAAGPSLRESLPLLAKLQGKVTTLAVSTALRPTLRAGVRPDFTALIDYHRMSKRYFEGIDPSLDIPMVCDLKATDDAVRAHPGPALFLNDLVMNTLFEGVFGDRGSVTQGSTVAHLAFRFLAHLGADPIILVGQDLSYPGGLIHVPGTAIQAQEYPSTHRFYSLEMRELEYYFSARQKFRKVPANRGGEVPTDEIFHSYLREFERMFESHAGRVWNATAGGAALAGAEVHSLESIVERFADAERPDFRALVGDAMRALDAPTVVAEARSKLADRRRELRELRSIYDKILKKLARVIRANEAGRAADPEVLEVQRLHQRAREYKLIYLYISHLAQSDSWKRIQADRRLDATGKTGVEKQLHQATRDRDYVQALHFACDFARECFERAATALDEAP